ncbi:hypothetical protein GOP47_0020349 [Adiantum capillus-veneris]|uniref:Uncharacterized protein n=1 Tax=Adiantum capillus-veneris TaxID=13818 RepID=A0A9D4UE60_ADICA|nr:hypothetical protein GOP47_0020349 [Adiantum capillus-veneris]
MGITLWRFSKFFHHPTTPPEWLLHSKLARLVVKHEFVLEPEEGVAEGVKGGATQRRGEGDARGERKVVCAAGDGLAALLPNVLNTQRREGAAVAQAGGIRQNEALRHEDGTARLLRDGEASLHSPQELRLYVLLLHQRHVEAEDGPEHVGQRRLRPCALHGVETLRAVSPLYDEVVVHC